MDELDETRTVPFVEWTVQKRWLTALPCAVFCIAAGGVHGRFGLFEELLKTTDEQFGDLMGVANAYRMFVVCIVIVISSTVLMKNPYKLNMISVIGFALMTGHVIMGMSIQFSSTLFFMLGNLMIAVGLGIIYAVGLRMMLLWIPESKIVAPFLAFASYTFGLWVGNMLLHALLRNLSVAHTMCAVGFAMVVIGIAISEDIYVPNEFDEPFMPQQVEKLQKSPKRAGERSKMRLDIEDPESTRTVEAKVSSSKSKTPRSQKSALRANDENSSSYNIAMLPPLAPVKEKTSRAFSVSFL